MVSPIVIGGPTGSGKSAYALSLAQQVGGEIICADSRQIYSKMRIGTASPTDEELSLVPHHNFNVIHPSESYDAARFIQDTDKAVSEILSRNKVPIIVGGTGLYLRCWRYGLSDVPQSDERLKQELKAKGREELYAELQSVDPESALSISSKDEFRIIRALEIFKMTGQKASVLRRSHFKNPRQVATWYLILSERAVLSERLLGRTKQMFKEGLVEEALALRSELGQGHAMLETMGYKESLAFADGNLTLESAVERTYFRTRQYAKRQITWFTKEEWWDRQLPGIRDITNKVNHD